MNMATGTSTDTALSRTEHLAGTHARCDPADLRKFADKWAVRRMWIYGSAACDDFGETSDIDVICDFGEESLWFHENSPGSTINYRGRCRMDLSDVFGRDADILSVEHLREERNPIKRENIWKQAVLVHGL